MLNCAGGIAGRLSAGCQGADSAAAPISTLERAGRPLGPALLPTLVPSQAGCRDPETGPQTGSLDMARKSDDAERVGIHRSLWSRLAVRALQGQARKHAATAGSGGSWGACATRPGSTKGMV
jgi:hypothetical protein